MTTDELCQIEDKTIEDPKPYKVVNMFKDGESAMMIVDQSSLVAQPLN